ncbi:Dihydrolipoyllysine-residue succinyltransferase [Phytophthora nicotianae]|uniref:Dihydrolipoyllysine-residue succinyltransferase n=1 Tax=Phytophthora nicotianae TaxID=4792 RepID=A0A0W8CH14_PHYNI|nr:Dihydrolipoyllysine-residue succinyltransferase [Phytophthora nicotianae]
MDIHVLLNDDDDSAEWEFEDSDMEDEIESLLGSEAGGEEETPASESDATVVIPPVHRKLSGNEYIDGLIRESGLHIIRDKEVQSAYADRGELGLFSLFFTRGFRDSLQNWTNTMLKEKGKVEATLFEIDAYIGLEIAMSIIPLTEIKELWSQKLFLGQQDFTKDDGSQSL